jgi:hypothetical protein
LLPGEREGSGRRERGIGELQERMASSIPYAKTVEKNITRCARRRGEGECQDRAAGYLVVLRIELTRWQRPWTSARN